MPEVIGVLLLSSAAYSLVVIWVAFGFRRRTMRDAAVESTSTAPGVSILVPLAGEEPGLEGNLAAYCRLAYGGPVQLVVGSLENDDAALASARLVAAHHPEADVCIVPTGGTSFGPNRKAALLSLLAARAAHDVLVAVDSDVRVRADYLERMVPELARPNVGLVTCYYRAPHPHTLAEAFEALSINTDFSPAAMVATRLGRSDFAFGASLMLRRDTLVAIGGFTTLVEYLADDHRLAELVITHGQKVVVAPHVVETDPHPCNLAAAIRHQLRWARTTRTCAPWGYAANVVTHSTTFAFLSAMPMGHPPHLAAAAAAIALRIAAAIAGSRALGTRLGWTVWLIPMRDLAGSVLWAASFAGDRVEWRGRTYRLRRDGRLVAGAGSIP